MKIIEILRDVISTNKLLMYPRNFDQNNLPNDNGLISFNVIRSSYPAYNVEQLATYHISNTPSSSELQLLKDYIKTNIEDIDWYVPIYRIMLGDNIIYEKIKIFK